MYGNPNIQPPRRSKRKAKWDAYVKRHRDRLTKRTKQMVTWKWEGGGDAGTVAAYTRSEARALVKAILGVKTLPKEVTLVARTE